LEDRGRKREEMKGGGVDLRRNRRFAFLKL
jgi:hypothetical protein